MKFEDRIIELLAEYLQKTDRLLDRMEKTDKKMEQTNRNVDIISKTTLDHSMTILDHNKTMLEHNTKFNIISEQIKQLEETNKIVLTEILSISKRVTNLESRPS